MVTATVRSPEHAAEVVQEVYLYVWLDAASFDEVRGTVLGWLLMLARRRAVDRVRHVVRARRPRRRTTPRPPSRPSPTWPTSGSPARRPRSCGWRVGRLSVVQRDAVALTFLDGYTHEQAAVLLSVPLGTLKTRVRAGVLSLRHQLAAPAA